MLEFKKGQYTIRINPHHIVEIIPMRDPQWCFIKLKNGSEHCVVGTLREITRKIRIAVKRIDKQTREKTAT